MVVTPGDPALSKELSAKLAARGGLFIDANGTIGAPGTGVTPPAAAPARPPLTPEMLQQMLENLGYSPSVVKTPTGETTFSLVVTRGTWTLRPTLALTTNGSHLAILHYITQKIDPTKVEAARWQKLLEANVVVAPNVFALLTATQQVLMYHTERNIDISPALLRQWLDQSMDAVIATHDSWKDLGTPTAPAAK